MLSISGIFWLNIQRNTKDASKTKNENDTEIWTFCVSLSLEAYHGKECFKQKSLFAATLSIRKVDFQFEKSV